MKRAVYLGLGSNSQNKLAMLRRARILITAILGVISKTSKIYHSDPWGYEEQPIFINQILLVQYDGDMHELHEQTQHIEQVLGKKKTSKYGPRNIDIDILLVDDMVYQRDDLEIPHPRLHLRNFVLIPLAEIAPGLIIPVKNESVESLLNQCTDNGKVTPVAE